VGPTQPPFQSVLSLFTGGLSGRDEKLPTQIHVMQILRMSRAIPLLPPACLQGAKRVNCLHFTPLHFTSLHFTPLHFTSLHFTPLHFTSLHFTSLHFTSLHFTSLHFTPLHFTPHSYQLSISTSSLSSADPLPISVNITAERPSAIRRQSAACSKTWQTADGAFRDGRQKVTHL
jgi:hypothetical protein